jgi:serine/threonine protein kinase
MQWFVAKVLDNDITKKGIEEVVRELAVSKLCSMLGIGPTILTSIPFDIVVSADAVQFHL